MINNNLTLSRDNKMSANKYSGLLNQDAQDYALHRHIRSRFLQQSAHYLGADLRDSKVLALCFGDYALDAPEFNK
jgi:hypothetical protein